jgi:hypothetical protein
MSSFTSFIYCLTIILFSCQNTSNNKNQTYIDFIENAVQSKTIEAKYQFTENHQGKIFSYTAECIGLKDGKNLNYYIKQSFDDSIISENYVVTIDGKQTTVMAYPKTYPADDLNDTDLLNIDFIDYKLLRYLFEDTTIIKRQKEDNITLQDNQLVIKDTKFTRTFVFNSANKLVQIINVDNKSNKTQTLTISSLAIDKQYHMEKENWMKGKLKL